MKILLCSTEDQRSFFGKFNALEMLRGHDTKVTTSTPTTLTELQFKCKAHGIHALLIANPRLLDMTLNGMLDYNPPASRIAVTLDDYQGSFLDMKGIPAVVLNPPERLQTVAYERHVFNKFISKLTKPGDWFPQTKFAWEVANESTITDLFARFQSARLIAVDIETPLNNPNLVINCISFTAWWPDNHTSLSIVLPMDNMFWVSWVRKFCAINIPKILQGGTYDALYLLRYGIPLHAWLYDTLNLFHSLFSELPKRLDFVAAYSCRKIRFWKDDGKTGNLEDYYRYNALDGWGTLNSCLSLLSNYPSWAKTNYLMEFPMVFPSLHCEIEGWKVDPVKFEEVRKEKVANAEVKLATLRTVLKAPEFNPRSHIHMKKLFTILGCGDLGSTDKAATMKAKFRHPLNATILEIKDDYVKDAKLLSTYITEAKFLGWRLYYRLNPAGTDTGRLASSESSYWIGFQIQNIPRGDAVKQFLISDPGWLLAEPDFEQSEARCVAYMSGDKKLLWLVESPNDYHSWNVQEFFGLPYESIYDNEKKTTKGKEAKEIRDLSKRTNHGANYNMGESVMLDTMGPKHVSKAKLLLKLPALWTLKQVCAYMLDRYATTYVGVKRDFYDAIIKEIELTSKLVSPLGWTRHFFSKPSRTNKPALNAAVAHGPQNLSVTIINRGFYAIWRRCVYGDFVGVVRIKAQIHDSIPYQYKVGSEWVNEEVTKMLRIPVQIKGADSVTRTMVIPPSNSWGKERWSELK